MLCNLQPRGSHILQTQEGRFNVFILEKATVGRRLAFRQLDDVVQTLQEDQRGVDTHGALERPHSHIGDNSIDRTGGEILTELHVVLPVHANVGSIRRRKQRMIIAQIAASDEETKHIDPLL